MDLAAPAEEVWEIVRHAPLGDSLIIRALFAIRTLPERLVGRATAAPVIRLDEMRSSEAHPGFQVLVDDAPHEVAVGAIGKVWKLAIPFSHVPDATAFDTFTRPGWIKVAWALRVVPRGAHESRLELELRVDATDEASWKKFRRYFLLIGRPSRFLRRRLLL